MLFQLSANDAQSFHFPSVNMASSNDVRGGANSVMEHLEVNDEREGGNGPQESIKTDPAYFNSLSRSPLTSQIQKVTG
jgi:hypothetical protein